MDANEKLLIYFEDEEHLVRRLGAAVISCWRDLPAAVRALLVERAKRVLDEEPDENIDQEIERFIRCHDARTLACAAGRAGQDGRDLRRTSGG